MTSAIEKAKRELDNLLMDICEELGLKYDRYEKAEVIDVFKSQKAASFNLPEDRYMIREKDSVKGTRHTPVDFYGNIIRGTTF